MIYGRGRAGVKNGWGSRYLEVSVIHPNETEYDGESWYPKMSSDVEDFGDFDEDGEGGMGDGIMQATRRQIMRVVANLDARVRDEFLVNWGRTVVRLAKRNLKSFHAERVAIGQTTGWTGALYKTVRFEDVRGDTVTVTFGDDLPYANVHNRPRAEGFRVVAVNKPLLIFPDRRFKSQHEDKKSKFVNVAASHRPTSGFMDEAVDEANELSYGMLEEAVDRSAKVIESMTPYTINARGGKSWRLGSISADAAEARGLIKPATSRRDGRVLTAKGKKYIQSRGRKRK